MFGTCQRNLSLARRNCDLERHSIASSGDGSRGDSDVMGHQKRPRNRMVVNPVVDHRGRLRSQWHVFHTCAGAKPILRRDGSSQDSGSSQEQVSSTSMGRRGSSGSIGQSIDQRGQNGSIGWNGLECTVIGSVGWMGSGGRFPRLSQECVTMTHPRPTSPPPLRFHWNRPKEGFGSAFLVWKVLCRWDRKNIRSTSRLR